MGGSRPQGGKLDAADLEPFTPEAGPASSTTEAAARWNGNPPGRSHFVLAPPRHFLYPAILLLLAEEPRHGYRLVDALLRLGFGPVDRPSVYRALGNLEADGLLRSWEAAPLAGSTRCVYGLTQDGHAALDAWMAIVAQEREGLDRVLTRHAALRAAPSPAAPSPVWRT